VADEQIQDTIAKLLRKAKGTSNENEAAIFAAKAQELLAKHNLTEAQIRARDERDDDPVDLHMAKRNNVAKWRTLIAEGCARLYFCQLLYHGSKVSFTGKAHNAEVAESMWDWLCSVVVRMSAEHAKEHGSWEKEDFKRGAAVRLQGRLYEIWRASYKPPVAPVGDGSGLPALYDSEGKAVADYLEQRFGKIKARKTKSIAMRGGGAAAGYDRAGDINLNTQVAETRTSRMIGSK
jgi:hypothetical protein